MSFPPDESQRPGERARLEALKRYDLLDTPPEPVFDRLTRLACRLFDVPVALVSLVDAERQWFKSNRGLDVRETAREASFCAYNIEQGAVMVVHDATQDARFEGSRLVHGEPHELRFYAGAPLTTRDGYHLGAFCVLDRAPRDFDEDDRSALRDFARQAMEEIERRRTEATWRASEARNRRLLEHLPVGVYRTTPEGQILEANDAMADLLGYDSVEALLRERVQDLYVDTEDRARHHQQLSGQRTTSAEFPLRRADGDVVWVRDYPQAVTRGESAEIGHFDGMLVDITEQRRAEESLRASEERYRRLLEGAPVPMLVHQEGEMAYANAAAADLVGMDNPEELVGRSIWAFVHPDFRQTIRTRLRTMTEQDVATEPAEIKLRLPGGQDREAEVTGIPVRYQGTPAVQAILRDVTEQRRYERGLRASERQYRQLFERATVPVMIFRPETERILEANAEACRTYGFVREELVGTPLTELTAAVERGQAEVQRILDEGGTRNFETVHYRKDGSAIHLLASCSLIQYEGDDAILYFGRDVTERKRVEEENEAWRAFYENTLDNIPLEIAVLDDEGRFLYLNKAAVPDEAVRREMIGKTDLDYARRREHDAQTLRKRHEWVLQVVEEKQERHLEETLTTPDGRRKHYRRVAAPIFDDEGEVNYVIGYSIDLTDQKRIEEKLVEAKEEAEEMARLKSTFLANMSHEIRTPLAAIIGFAEVLVEESEGEKSAFAELIQQGGERLSETLDSVLDLARLEAGGFEPDFESVSVRSTMQEAAALYGSLAEEKGLAFELTLPEEDLTLWADRAGVARVLANLLSNAIKFTDEGAITLAGRRAAEDAVELRVSDTGQGMSAAFREHLFEAFRQESSGLGRLHEGTGLGLTISRRLAEVMEADIQVRSEEGKGSTFVVRFPEQPPQQQGASSSPSSSASPSEDESDLGRLLVVEDNRDTRRLLDHLLGTIGTPTVVSSPQEAFDAAAETDFDVILLDINLGADLDGTEVMERLREDEHYAAVPFVAVTAYAMPGDENRFADAGFDAYLAKPFTRKDLMRVLRVALG